MVSNSNSCLKSFYVKLLYNPSGVFGQRRVSRFFCMELKMPHNSHIADPFRECIKTPSKNQEDNINLFILALQKVERHLLGRAYQRVWLRSFENWAQMLRSDSKSSKIRIHFLPSLFSSVWIPLHENCWFIGISEGKCSSNGKADHTLRPV